MRKAGKYILALCFFVSLGLAWLPILELSAIKISLYDIFKLAIDAESIAGNLQEVSKLLHNYMQPFLYVIGIWVILLCAAAICCLVLRKKAVFQGALLSAVIINIYTIGAGSYAIQKLEETKEAFDFLNLNLDLSLNIVTAGIWIALYSFIIALSIYGLLSYRKQLICEDVDDVIPEMFHAQENPWEDHQEFTKMEVSHPEPQTPVLTKENPVRNTSAQLLTSFYGVVIGTGTLYHDYAYELDEKVEIFFHNTKDYMEVYPHRTAESIVSLYYIPEYQEYCVKPLRHGSVFLESGQPLGENRCYYLPRGMNIYLLQSDYSFKLG